MRSRETSIISWICLAIFLVSFEVISEVSGESAVVNISYIRERPSESSLPIRSYVTYCAAYNPELSRLPTKTAPETWSRLQFGGAEVDLCDESQTLPVAESGVFFAANRRNCSAYDQGVTAQHAKTSGLLIVSHKMFFPGQPNRTVTHPSTFPILVMKESDMDEIEELPFTESWQVHVYAAEDRYLVDGSGICLIVLAVIVITIGSLRSGQHRLMTLQAASERLDSVMECKTDPDDHNKQQSDADRGSVHFGSVTVVVFALIMTALLILMYYFYDYLVFVFIGLFVIGAVSGCFECFKPILSWSPNSIFRIPLGVGCLAKCCGSHLDIRAVVLFLISCSLSVAWVVTRNYPLGWILLDILGSFLLVSVLMGIQLPNLKSCTIFLSLLFLYDIFFVFITPFFTKDGQSVMIQVATGGSDPARDSGSGQREVIPAAFKIPHIPTGALCEDLFEDSSYSLLGFGDVMVPGFLISYLRGFELATRMRPVYFVSACFAYMVSLTVTTVALIVMRTGQPALLYIVPILLSTVFFIAWRRRELSQLWNGRLLHLYRLHHGLPIPHQDFLVETTHNQDNIPAEGKLCSPA